MPKRSKEAVLDPTRLHGGGVNGEAKSQFKYHTLMQDYQELRREAFVTKNRLEEAKQRKLILAAEVRFLRSRYNLLVREKNMSSLREQNFGRPLDSHGRTRIMKQQKFSRKESHLHRLPPFPEQPKMKRKIIEEVTMHDACTLHDQHLNPKLPVGKEAPCLSVTPPVNMNHMRKANSRKETLVQNNSTVLELNVKDAVLRKSVMAFDLNQLSSSFSGKEGSLSSRVPVFDLNEVSTGDEEFPGNGEAVKLEEAKKNLLLGNDELHKDLKLAICRNSGEASSHTGKRKITWKDPVALRV